MCLSAGATAGNGMSACATGTTTIGAGPGGQPLGGLVVARVGIAAFGMKKEPAAPHMRLGCVHLHSSFVSGPTLFGKKRNSTPGHAITKVDR